MTANIDNVIASAAPVSGFDRIEARLAEEARLAVGGNNPPEPIDPFTAYERDIEDLREEAKLWLDGTPIENDAQAKDVATLIDKLAKARKAADAARDAEKRPHLEAGRAVDAKYKPLIEKADTAVTVAKSAQRTWMLKVQEEQRAEAARLAAAAREEAARALRAVQDANAAGDLAAREQADTSLDAAAALIRDAKRADKAKPAVRGEGATRALGLRTVWVGTVTDSTALLRHLWSIPEHKAALEDLAQSIVNKEVRAGRREMPGVEIKQEQVL